MHIYIKLRLLIDFLTNFGTDLSYDPLIKNQLKRKGKGKKDFCFSTVLGMEAELPFGSPQKQLSFFEPIFKEFKQKIREMQGSRALDSLGERPNCPEH